MGAYMKRMKIETLLTTVLLILVALAGPATAGLSIAPSVTEILLNENEIEPGRYVVKNTGEDRIAISVSLQDWMGRMYDAPDEVPVQEWLQLSDWSFELDPGEQKEIKFKVFSLENFTKERVAQVFFEYMSGTNILQRMGVIVYCTPFKNIETLSAEITALESRVVGQGADLSLRFDYQIKNNSQAHIRPIGRVELRNAQNKMRVREWLIEKVPGVFPGKTSEWNLVYPLLNLKPGIYEAEMIVDYGAMYKKDGRMSKTIMIDLSELPGPKA